MSGVLVPPRTSAERSTYAYLHSLTSLRELTACTLHARNDVRVSVCR